MGYWPAWPHEALCPASEVSCCGNRSRKMFSHGDDDLGASFISIKECCNNRNPIPRLNFVQSFFRKPHAASQGAGTDIDILIFPPEHFDSQTNHRHGAPSRPASRRCLGDSARKILASLFPYSLCRIASYTVYSINAILERHAKAFVQKISHHEGTVNIMLSRVPRSHIPPRHNS